MLPLDVAQVEARKQFEIADVCCDMVTDHINFLSRSLTILKELEPKLQQAKAESQQRRKEFEDKFKGPPVSEPALTISTADRQSLGLPPLLRSGDKPRHVVRNSAPAPEVCISPLRVRTFCVVCGASVSCAVCQCTDDRLVNGVQRTKVFGTELSALLKRSPNSRSSIPPFVDKAISYLEAKGTYLTSCSIQIHVCVLPLECRVCRVVRSW
jgi:hypothetical protein